MFTLGGGGGGGVCCIPKGFVDMAKKINWALKPLGVKQICFE